ALQARQRVSGEGCREAPLHADAVADQRLGEVGEGPALADPEPYVLVLAVLLAFGKSHGLGFEHPPRDDYGAGAEQAPARPELEEPVDALCAGLYPSDAGRLAPAVVAETIVVRRIHAAARKALDEPG